MTDREILEQLLAGQQKTNACLTKVEDRLTTVEDHLTTVEDRLTTVENRLSTVDNRLSAVENDVSAMKFRLENTTDKNIQIIAENYSNLSSKLDKNNVITDQQFAYQIKVNYLMDDVKMLKMDVKELKSAVGI